MENGDLSVIFLSLAISITSITMLIACLCCRKKVQRNELLGLEGMVKIKNPDEGLLNGNQAVRSSEIDILTLANEITDSRRSINVGHRSLPDIPVPDKLDTGSDLYATVGEKAGDVHRTQNPSLGATKQINLSQHSSTSQPDDSSPYARVRSTTHAYDKVRPAEEHPYAQIAKSADENENPRPTTSANGNLSAANNNRGDDESSSSREADTVDSIQHQQVIPAASAIAGRVSASQELPYMTPPIVQAHHQQQHFSGDSQDSSKGYTSISVREPLANIIAQTKKQNAQSRRSDSHYTTVSDDDDEMYAAIEDPNNTYTSGSETYAQIQPTQEPLVVSVEVNPMPAHAAATTQPQIPLASHPSARPSNPVTPRSSVIDTASEMMHSRQESTSSCTSAVSNMIGSPKPEKRQANSPLPPTPKGTSQYQSNITGSSGSISMQVARNSIASTGVDAAASMAGQRHTSRDNVRASFGADMIHEDYELKIKTLSKDLEGMYAKVNKQKGKSVATLPADASPPHFHQLYAEQLAAQSVFLSDPDIAHGVGASDALDRSGGPSSNASPDKGNGVKYAINDYETIDKRRARVSSANYDTGGDPAYETIPADLPRATAKPSVSRNILAHVTAPSGIPKPIRQPPQLFTGATYDDNNSEPGYESLPDQSSLSHDHGYETVKPAAANAAKKDGSDYDPNYETLRPTLQFGQSDDLAPGKGDDGYTCIEPVTTAPMADTNSGYSSPNNGLQARFEHGYASIRESAALVPKYEEDIYTSIPHESMIPLAVPSSASGFSLGSDGKKISSPSSDSDTSTSIHYNRMLAGDMAGTNSHYESSTASDTDSNYETLRLTKDADDGGGGGGGGGGRAAYSEADIKYDTLKLTKKE